MKLGISKSRTLAFALNRAAQSEKVSVSRRDKSSVVRLTPAEQDAIDRLYAELTPEYWTRRRSLEARQRITPLPAEDREELLRLIDEGEAWNVRRLTSLFSLARSRGVSPDALLDSLHLRHHPLAERD